VTVARSYSVGVGFLICVPARFLCAGVMMPGLTDILRVRRLGVGVDALRGCSKEGWG
jgi:hypothetical protein